MKSLEFGNLPLAEVACQVFFQSPADLSWDLLESMRSRLAADFPEVEEYYVTPTKVRFALQVGVQPGMQLSSATGATVEIRPTKVRVSWLRQGSAAYPRYAFLRRALQNLSVGFGTTMVPRVVNMSYVNRISLGSANLESLIRPSFLAERACPIREVNLAWERPNGLEARLQILPDDSAMLLVTTIGTTVDGDATDELIMTLDNIHDELQSMFLELITEEARNLWSLEH